jgi:hypothetical protein
LLYRLLVRVEAHESGNHDVLRIVGVFRTSENPWQRKITTPHQKSGNIYLRGGPSNHSTGDSDPWQVRINRHPAIPESPGQPGLFSLVYNPLMTTPQGYVMNKEDYDRRELDRLMKIEEIERLKRQRAERLAQDEKTKS